MLPGRLMLAFLTCALFVWPCPAASQSEAAQVGSSEANRVVTFASWCARRTPAVLSVDSFRRFAIPARITSLMLSFLAVGIEPGC